MTDRVMMGKISNFKCNIAYVLLAIMKKNHIKKEIKNILRRALIEGINLLKSREEEIERKRQWYLSDWDYYRFGTIKYFDSGVINYDSGRKFKFESIINHTKDTSVLPSWSQYHEYIRDTKGISHYYDLSDRNTSTEEAKELHLSIHTIFEIRKLLGSYIYLNERKIEVNEHLIDKLVVEHTNRIFIESIRYDIWIPIVFTKFRNDYYKVSDKISIQKIPEKFQIARNAHFDNFTKSRANQLLIEGCSHAIVITGFNSLNKTSNSYSKDFLAEIESRNFKEILDKLIGAINIITGEQIFHHQIFTHSTSCVSGRYADIEAVNVTYVDDELPEYLTDYGWLRKPRLISSQELEDIKLLFNAMITSNNTKLNFAARKLISASFRNKSEDALLDSTIGLESILSNDSKSEITYRLSSRGAFVCKLNQLNNFSPSEIRDFLKKIYSYRSAIVHGSKESDKRKKSKIELNGISYHCNYLALIILRHCLRFFINNPKYIDLKELENEILNN